MIYLKKYDTNDTYMAPSGAIMDKEKVLKDYPAAAKFTFVVQTDQAQQVMYGFYNLAAMKSQYGIDMSLGDDEAVAALADAMNAEQDAQAAAAEEAANTATAEERIAAALEYQVMSSLPDEDAE